MGESGSMVGERITSGTERYFESDDSHSEEFSHKKIEMGTGVKYRPIKSIN